MKARKKAVRERLAPTSELSRAMIGASPIGFDWSRGYGELWEYAEASRCEECGEAVAAASDGAKHSEYDPNSKCRGYVPSASGPMMNYFYPLHDVGDAHAAALKIVDLPLCVVTFLADQDDAEGVPLLAGQVGLALTGGGMDLSWEIAEAYMRLGLLPPIHFRLPAMAGRGATDSGGKPGKMSPRDAWVVAGMRASIGAARRSLEWAERDLDHVAGKEARS